MQTCSLHAQLMFAFATFPTDDRIIIVDVNYIIIQCGFVHAQLHTDLIRYDNTYGMV